MDKRMMLKLNGGRAVTGILRGFDPFMNVVLDDTVEECKDNTKNNIGMVVRCAAYPAINYRLTRFSHLARLSAATASSWWRPWTGSSTRLGTRSRRASLAVVLSLKAP